MPSSVLGVEIAELNLSPLSSLSPSVCICTSACVFYLPAGRGGFSGRSDVRRPTLPLFFNSSVSRALSHHLSTLCSGLGEDTRWGMGPRTWLHKVGHFPTWHSDCVFLPPTSVSQYPESILNTLSSSVLPCFSSGILEVAFLSGGITDDINLRKVGTGGARSVSVAFKPVYWRPQEECVLHRDPVHVLVHVMYGFP